MNIEIRTIITSTVHVGDDGIEGVEHVVTVDGDALAESLPGDAIMAIVLGGCRSTIKSIEDKENGQ